MKKVIGHNQARKKLMSNLSVQSWLICGKKGIGKATLAKSFSNWLLVKDCGSAALDLHIAQGDTIGIEKVREMKNFLHLSPIQSEYKIAIIDSLEAMTNNAKNAILKILEEPPKNSKIFIISHNPCDIQTTIRCRCFQLNLLPLTYDETKQIVSLQCEFDDEIFNEIATLFPGMPGRIISAMNKNTYEVYKSFYTFFHNLNDPSAINKLINSEIELELASHIVQSFILKGIKKDPNNTETLLSQWEKIDQLFASARQFHLDKKHVLANAINIISPTTKQVADKAW
ncbi:DNA polymerase III subunit delta' [Wolbachia endosymbiont of Folsomia candida]|uniref:DNA polymerase III subunit delta' n=1 Tax=Wolbachia endosymbiont of Folsomia candida TaxID=169402 RepID=UPI000AE49171|nr:DNA polymerase III subunit delta' [Wolbachia endosymbiont of Folsomia candida]APR98782.1 DNA polymerase III subunit delta' [Wolbachia endosymbiont of Folsomia candida]